MIRINYLLTFILLIFTNIVLANPSKELQLIMNEFKAAKESNITPLALIDLDETLINSNPRKFLSIKSALNELRDKYPQIVEKAKKLTLKDLEKNQNQYDLNEFFAKASIYDVNFVNELSALMLPHYLSSEYMRFDSEVPCAVSYIRTLMRHGLVPIFISSRFKSTQGRATFESLNRIGLIRPKDHYKLLLRPNDMDSLTFKKMALKNIDLMLSRNHTLQVELLMENEPENLNVWKDHFSYAMSIFVKGAMMKPVPLKMNAFKVRNFCSM